MIWLQRLSHVSIDRLRAGFDAVELNAKRWPTPAAIMEALPTYEHTYKPKPEAVPVDRQIAVDPDQAERSRIRIQKMIADCAQKLGIES